MSKYQYHAGMVVGGIVLWLIVWWINDTMINFVATLPHGTDLSVTIATALLCLLNGAIIGAWTAPITVWWMKKNGRWV